MVKHGIVGAGQIKVQMRISDFTLARCEVCTDLCVIHCLAYEY